MRVLLIDNNIEPDWWGSPDLRRCLRKLSGVTVHIRRAPHEDLPENLNHYDKIMISGSMTSILDESDWINKLHKTIDQALHKKMPMLGICYGHQMIIKHVGGKDHVRKAPEPEFGWTEIRVHAESRLFEGLPKKFYSFSSHYDEVHKLPQGVKSVASSAVCPIQAYEFIDRPVFGIQFHPERNLEEGRDAYLEHKKKGRTRYFYNADQDKKLYDPNIEEVIFKNFIKL